MFCNKHEFDGWLVGLVNILIIFDVPVLLWIVDFLN